MTWNQAASIINYSSNDQSNVEFIYNFNYSQFYWLHQILCRKRFYKPLAEDAGRIFSQIKKEADSPLSKMIDVDEDLVIVFFWSHIQVFSGLNYQTEPGLSVLLIAWSNG